MENSKIIENESVYIVKREIENEEKKKKIVYN